MTTAHRPTFNPAKGGTGRGEGDLSKLSTQFAARDMPGHLTLKYRQKGQAHPDEVKEKNLRYELEEKERDLKNRKRENGDFVGAIEEGTSSKKQKYDESDENPDNDVDADTDEDDDDESDDDDAELMAELERIKKERAAEQAKKEAEAREEQERIRKQAMIRGNPLLNMQSEDSSEFKVKRRWDDDVVFKNCAKGINERKKEPVFINDSIRSHFHRKFMDKYIK